MLLANIDNMPDTLFYLDHQPDRPTTPTMRSERPDFVRIDAVRLPSSSPSAPSPTETTLTDKGKAVSKPAPIDILPIPSSSKGHGYDTFYSFSPSTPELARSPSSVASTSFGPFTPNTPCRIPTETRDVKGKGKEKEAPQLPPLTFTPDDFMAGGLDPFLGALDSSVRSAVLDMFTPPNSPDGDVTIPPKSSRRQSLPEASTTSGKQERDRTNYRFSFGGGKVPRLQYDLPSYYPKLKGRTYSAPLPVPIHIESQPIPLVPRNYFDRHIPKEIHLHILKAVVDLAEATYLRRIERGDWSILRASSPKNRWVGQSKGMRELIKLSRVSKSWHSLVYDGQLWKNFDMRCFSVMPRSTVLQIAKTAGTFVKSLNLHGLSLDGADIIDITDSFRLRLPSSSHTQLTSIGLEKANITTRSLHYLLIHSPFLLHLSVKGLKAMKNATCEVLSVYNPRLISLNASRCPDLDGNGIQSLCTSSAHQRHIPLKELCISGMNKVNRVMFKKLGKAAPDLEVLDVSYVPQMHNAYLEAFCAVTEEEMENGVPYVVLSAHQAGRQEVGRYCRRITKLRHLNLSCCTLLTDMVCSNIAYAVPHLELLELAGIETLEDDGLVRLIQTTPYLRRLDLEDASTISDDVIHALTPSAPPSPESPVEPGHKLEHITISYANDITNGALLAFIRACPCLVTLEADNTRISSPVIREFVNLSQSRKLRNAAIVAVDCRGISEKLVKDLASVTRPRKGWRAYESRKLNYVDGRDGTTKEIKGAQDECDPDLVVLKTFYSWQNVDTVSATRVKRRSGSRRNGSDSSTSADSDDESSDIERLGRGGRWWSAGRRLSRSGASSPTNLDRDGCVVM